MARHMRYLRASRVAQRSESQRTARAGRRPTASCMPGPFGRRSRRRGFTGRGSKGSESLSSVLAFANAYALLDDDDKVALAAIADGTYTQLDWDQVENAVMEVEESLDFDNDISDVLSDALTWAMEEDEREYEEAERAKGRRLGERDAERTSYLSRRRQ